MGVVSQFSDRNRDYELFGEHVGTLFWAGRMLGARVYYVVTLVNADFSGNL